MQNRDFRTRLTSLYWSQTPSVVLSTHYSVLSRRRKSLYWFQPSPVVLCMQNSDFRSRMTSLCGSKTPPVAFACKTVTSGPEWQVSMDPRHGLSFCACTTACLASELLVSMGPSVHLWFLHAKQRLLDQDNKSIFVPDITSCHLHANSVISTRNTSLYGCQPSSVVFACKTASFGPEYKSLLVPDLTCRFVHAQQRD